MRKQKRVVSGISSLVIAFLATLSLAGAI
ncbi:MAG: hypothetical protein DRK00_08900 [Thermoprotei archaeon]|nr:MAG: hypothetical protein DRK00_08900 [Thermoprotei archaeon]